MQNIKFTIVNICEFIIASSMHKYICIVQPSPLSIARTFSPFITVTLYPLNTTFSFCLKLILDNYHFTFCLYEFDYSSHFSDFPVAQMIKNLPVMQKTRVLSLGWEVPLEKGMAIHSSILACRIPWTEKPGGLQTMELQRVGHDWVTNTHTHNSHFL